MPENHVPTRTLDFKIASDGKIFKTIELLPVWDEPKRIDSSRLRKPVRLQTVSSPDIAKTAELVGKGQVKLEPVVVFCDDRGHYWQATDFDRSALLERCKIPLATLMHAYHGSEDDARRYAILTGHGTDREV